MKWGILGAVIYKNWEMADLTELKEYADNYRVGQDFGYSNDESATVFCHYDKKKKIIYILAEIYAKELFNFPLSKLIKEQIGRLKLNSNIPIFCDCAERKSVDELKTYKINAYSVKKGAGSIDFGIKFLQKHKIIIDIQCQNFKNEIGQYKWKESKDGTILPIPVGKNDHCLTGDTIINLANNNNIRIDNLVGKTGEIHCYDLKNNKPAISKFYDVRKTKKNIEVYKIELEDGREIKLTNYHPVLTNNGWKTLKTLNICNDKIIDISNSI